MTTELPDLGALYLRHRAAMYRMAAVMLRGTGHEDSAEDVVQAVVTKLVGAMPAEPPQNWEAWLIQCVKNQVKDLLKLASTRREVSKEPEVTPEWGMEDDFAEQVAERVVAEDAGVKVREALGCLTAKEREVVWSVCGKEQSQTDVARRLGISPGRVSQLKKSGLNKLHQQMQQQGVHDVV
ncbi:hypothetical protein GCM10023081_00190 [Arthrobacter ginkgonis]|uniref:Uncharacterized protein n=1 Tax=Arthrobacter ginkgonis TaxID=1630594 RepID=A0ABP7BMN4_9MICC